MIDVLFDRRATSHMSVGMIRYVRELAARLPQVAPDLRIAFAEGGDNFDPAEQLALPLAAAAKRARLLHVPSPYVPLFALTPLIVTIHDLIELHFPAYAKPTVQPYYRYGVGPVLRRARRIITLDDKTADDLERFFGVRRERVRILPLATDLDDALGSVPHTPPARPYFFYAGNHRPHKNLITLVRAWQALPAAYDVDLLVTGDDDTGEAFRSLTREHGRLTFVGDRSPSELAALYAHAAAYVHPALREGFGLPQLEAMRCGAPVIASHGALPAILAPFAYPFEATDVGELRDLLARAIEEPLLFRRGAEAARAATRELTWEHTARLTADVYREALG